MENKKLKGEKRKNGELPCNISYGYSPLSSRLANWRGFSVKKKREKDLQRLSRTEKYDKDIKDISHFDIFAICRKEKLIREKVEINKSGFTEMEMNIYSDYFTNTISSTGLIIWTTNLHLGHGLLQVISHRLLATVFALCSASSMSESEHGKLSVSKQRTS